MFEINLDLPEDRRWAIIFNVYESKLEKIKPILKNLIDTYMKNYWIIIKPLIKIYKISKKIMYEKELTYFAKRLDIDFEYILLLQLIYETSACCTSIVSKVDDKYCMFRTMDWPMEFLKDITIDLKFTKNNQIIFYATSWVGYIGILTCMIPNTCCIAVNYRRTCDMNFINLIKNVSYTMKLKYPIGYLIRDICENETNIDKINNRLCNTHLISPCYFTICYDKRIPEIITRDITSYRIYSHEYVIQTNCDFDKNEPNILYSVKRRNVAKIIISNFTNNFDSINNMKDYLLIHPILNEDTIYITMMHLSQNHYESSSDL
jgi:hypothetical protein